MTDGANEPLILHVTAVPITLSFFVGQIDYLKAHGFRVGAISSKGRGLDEFCVAQRIECDGVDIARDIAIRSDIVSLWRLCRTFRRRKPDIVHAHTPKAGLVGTAAARFAGVPVVALSVFGLPQMTKRGLSRHLLNLTTWVSCQLADLVWCDSISMKEYLINNKLVVRDKVVVLGNGSVNGVDATHTFSPSIHGTATRIGVRAHYGIQEDAVVVGFVGRIVGDKGMHELIAAWRVLREQSSSLHLLMIGPFESKDPLVPEDETLLRSDPRIHLAGMRKDVAEHFSAMDIFVMPSYREGFGVTNIEAAAMALPVVATRIPGCVDSVHDGVTGTLVPVRDSAALVAAIRVYLVDPDLRRKHGAAGRERVLREFRQETIWNELRQEYTRLLRTKGIFAPDR